MSDNPKKPLPPLRRGKVPEHLREPYIPEYMRLNITPVQAQPTGKEEFRRPKQRGRLPQPRQQQGSHTEKVSVRARPPNVGVHDEQVWTKENQSQPIIDNNEYVDVDRLQGVDPFSNDEVQMDTVELERNTDKEDTSSKLEQGEYLVSVSGNLLYRTYSLEQAVLACEEILMQYDVQIDDIELVHRLALKFGVSTL